MQINLKLTVIDSETGDKIGESEIREKVSLFCKIIQENSQKNDVIFIDIPRSLDTICAIISCLEIEIPFTFCEENCDFEHFRTTLVFDGQQVRRIGENKEPFEGICYVITTSGTTGKRKQVAVPGGCIWPNVDDFCSLFSVRPSDSILFSTSLRFDPSIVELFMAFRVGCTIVLTPDNFRSEPFRLQKAIEKYTPSIAQFTATVLEMLPSVDALLNATSPLRILLIGGSHFPLKFINSHRKSENSTRIFNVYGVTEVSCWATIREIEVNCREALLGEPVGGSTLRISEDGDLIIGGPRQCYVNGKMKEEHRTGDRVECVENGDIRIVGRMDRMIKHRGVRVCLDHLTSEALRESPDARAIHFMYHNKRNLVQFVVGPTSTTVPQRYTKTMKILGGTEVPVTVCHVASLPINSSGKVDERQLAEGLNAISDDFDICEFLESRLNIRFTNEILNGNFSQIGLKSLLAVEISTFFPADLQDDVIRIMLDGSTTIRKFLEMFETKWKRERQNEDVGGTVEVSVTRVKEPEMQWEVNMRKCIDGNVLVVSDNLVVCAAHSGLVCAVNPRNGNVIWRIECGVRFEATPILVNQDVVIGSKNGGLFFISIFSGTLTARIFHDPGHSIGVRAKCSFDGQFIYCTSEYGNCHVIDPVTKSSVSDVKVGKGGGTSVGPVVGVDGAIYAVITSGWIARITVDKEYGSALMTWQQECGPLFAEPVLFGSQSVIVLNVHGVLRIFDTKTGDVTNQISLDSDNCFCAPIIIENRALVGTKSGKLVLLNLAPVLEIRKIFVFDLPGISFVRPPKSIREGEVLAMMSTNGWLLTGRLLESLEDVKAVVVSQKEVFTSPEFLDEMTVLVAGRDDHLRAWLVQGLL